MFFVYNVSGHGINHIENFLNILPKVPTNIKPLTDEVEMHIDTTFSVSGVGTVIGGQLVSGRIKVGDKLCLGPIEGKYIPIQVRSIHCKRVRVQEVKFGSYVCLGIKKVDRKLIRRGHVVISVNSEKISVREFEADITVLKAHSTTI